MWAQLRRFSSLDDEARGLFVRAAVLLRLISFLLWIRGFRFTQSALERFSPHKNVLGYAGDRVIGVDARPNPERIALTVRMVRAASRHTFAHATCLEQSLALWFLLRHQSVESDLRLGARKSAGSFEAHAWVECDGVALNDGEDVHRHYAAFEPALPSATEAS